MYEVNIVSRRTRLKSLHAVTNDDDADDVERFSLSLNLTRKTPKCITIPSERKSALAG